jgi:hypothetical protein
MAPLQFDRVPSAPLSLWQSAVAEHARYQLEQTGNNVSRKLIMQHPMVSAAADHVTGTFSDHPPTEPHGITDTHALNVYLSHLCYEKANATFSGDVARADYFAAKYRKFSDKDPGFVTCATTYLEYKIWYQGKFLYNDWTIQGNNDLNYGVIDWQLPSDAKVAIIGDWGTGLDDAIQLVKNIVDKYHPAAIIHLGDIYYSGTPKECTDTFVQALADAGAGNIPVFTIPGNHDYYALGYGFYPMLTQLNTHIEGAAQQASYFCLRTVDGGYQFLGMDTGFNDANPGDQANPYYAGPWLQPTEVAWHQDKLNNFGGATILLSHHQLYSTNAKLNGSYSSYAGLPYLNPYLYQVFWPYLQTKIAAWIWGHEHNFALYKPGLLQLQQGILLGCSAYEELTSANPYAQTYPQVPYSNVPANWQLGTNTDPNGTGYYNHAFAILDFGQRKSPTDAVVVNYYQYPAWGVTPPANPASSLLAQIAYSMPAPRPAKPVMYGDLVNLFCQEGLFISPLYHDLLYKHNYPTATTDNPVVLILDSGKTGPVAHGDVIRIRTLETAAGDKNQLGAWSTTTLYYYSGSYDQLEWTILKKDPGTGAQVNYGDEIYLVNNHYNQWLTLYWSKVYGNVYLTTRADAGYYWKILPSGNSEDKH